ncbi:hypothetical protein B0O80DRAFT_447136, partial [Mortierella sp. GBAus27b]
MFGESPEMKEPQISLNPSSAATHVLLPYPPAQSSAMCCLAPHTNILVCAPPILPGGSSPVFFLAPLCPPERVAREKV